MCVLVRRGERAAQALLLLLRPPFPLFAVGDMAENSAIVSLLVMDDAERFDNVAAIE